MLYLAGGAKGMAHIGVLAALIENGIHIDYISGCSSGSIVASLYACGYTPNDILKLVKINANSIIDYDNTIGVKLVNTVFTKKISIKGFVKGNKLEKLLRHLYKIKGIKNISDVKTIPLAIPAVNLQTGAITYFSNISNIDVSLCAHNAQNHMLYDDFSSCKSTGDLADIVRASCSFPGVFVPKIIGEDKYIDGGVRVNSPVKILKAMGADKVICVSFDCNNTGMDIHNIIGISNQAINIISHTSNTSEQEISDVHIRICAKNVGLLDFTKSIILAKRGYNIVNKNISYIKHKLGI